MCLVGQMVVFEPLLSGYFGRAYRLLGGPNTDVSVTGRPGSLVVTVENYSSRSFEACRGVSSFEPNRLRIAPGVCRQNSTEVDEVSKCCALLAMENDVARRSGVGAPA